MTAQFDENGDMWIDVAGAIPQGVQAGACSMNKDQGGGAFTAVTQINLTSYIRHAVQPSWAQAALSSSSAKITIVGNTPTTDRV